MYVPGASLAPEMEDASRPARKDWLPWKAIESTVTDADLDALERGLRLRLPPAYRAFLKYRHFYELSETGVRFAPHVPGRWRDQLLTMYYESWDPERIIDMGLIPFGAETSMDAGPVCFDTRTPLPDGDYPVVFWDHEWIGTAREVQAMFSSSVRMFQALRYAIDNGPGFLYHGESDEPEILAKKHQRLQGLFAIEPEGAGGAAREYWTRYAMSAVF